MAYCIEGRMANGLAFIGLGETMTNFLFGIGVAASIASIVGLLISAPGLKSKFIHLAYAVFITALASGIVEYQNRVSAVQRQLEETYSVERQANALLKTADRSTSGSMAGFMLASLSFLEKHKLRLPDTYARAVKLCENSGCAESGYAKGANSLEHYYSMQEASGAMESLIRGIAVSDKGSEHQ
jgi:hypothetical protein